MSQLTREMLQQLEMGEVANYPAEMTARPATAASRQAKASPREILAGFAVGLAAMLGIAALHSWAADYYVPALMDQINASLLAELAKPSPLAAQVAAMGAE